MDWARRSCCIRSAGGLTSRDEYSMTGSVVSVLESVRVRPVAAGNWVRSIDCHSVSCSQMACVRYAYSQYPPPMLKFTKHNARLLRLHRVNSFAIRKAPALNQPLYNDAPPCMYPTSQSPPCPGLAQPGAISHSPARAARVPSLHLHPSAWSASSQPSSSRRRSAGRMSRLRCRARGCIWLERRVAPGQPSG
jgi:hypothetical protein